MADPNNEYGTTCNSCGKYFIYEELRLDDSTSEGDGPELYYCTDCNK